MNGGERGGFEMGKRKNGIEVKERQGRRRGREKEGSLADPDLVFLGHPDPDS